MPELPIAFDPNEQAPNAPRETALVPRAWYAARIETSEIKVTKKDEPVDQQGRALGFTFRIIEGKHAGVVFFDNLNIINLNPKAVTIAKGDLTSICQAVGHATAVPNSDVLHGQVLDVLLDVEPPSGKYRAKNVPNGYKPVAEGRSRTAENVALQNADAPTFQVAGMGQAPGTVAAPPAVAGGSGAVPQPPVTPPAVAQPVAAPAPAVATTPAPAPGQVPSWGGPPPPGTPV